MTKSIAKVEKMEKQIELIMNNTSICIPEHDLLIIFIPGLIVSFFLLIISCVFYRKCVRRRQSTAPEDLLYTRQS